jgi:hypothetical protein
MGIYKRGKNGSLCCERGKEGGEKPASLGVIFVLGMIIIRLDVKRREGEET